MAETSADELYNPDAPGEIRGKVTDENDMPLSGITVELFDSGGNTTSGYVERRITTDAQGEYAFLLLAAGM
ncbi:MAG: carboxypeptidase-like regulatory domain-containing protein [Caldilineaceae bacterium]